MPEAENKLYTVFLAALAIMLVLSMVHQPEVAYEAAADGLRIWWQIVCPALLPFFIVAQLLMGLGVVHAMGVLLEPIMRPLFNIPGCGSFVLAMGLASGYPIGAVLTGELREQNLINHYEGERLVCSANTADPLFMAGAVAVGMLGNQSVAATIMIAHYISALLNGLVVRFWAPAAPPTTIASDDTSRPLPVRAVTTLFEARRKDGRPLGNLLGDAVNKSISTLLTIGGFIVLFSIIIDVVAATGVIDYIHSIFTYVLCTGGLSQELAPALTSGIFEITLGCEKAAEATAPLADQLMVIGAVIAWSGLSVHGQVAAILQSTDISTMPYTFSRIIHAVFAAAVTKLLLPYAKNIGSIARAVSPVFKAITDLPHSLPPTWFTLLCTSCERLAFVCGLIFILLVVSVIISLRTT